MERAANRVPHTYVVKNFEYIASSEMSQKKLLETEHLHQRNHRTKAHTPAVQTAVAEAQSTPHAPKLVHHCRAAL
jgi:hypothetical protein